MDNSKGIPTEAPPPYQAQYPGGMPSPAGPAGPMPPGPPLQGVHVAVTPCMAPLSSVVIYPRVSTMITCNVCQAQVMTSTQLQTGDATWNAALVFCLLLGIIGCLIPFCMDSTKDVVHTCPNCTAVVGTNKGQFC